MSVAARVSMAVRMREVLARPRFGVCVPLGLSLHCLHCFLVYTIEFISIYFLFNFKLLQLITFLNKLISARV